MFSYTAAPIPASRVFAQITANAKPLPGLPPAWRRLSQGGLHG